MGKPLRMSMRRDKKSAKEDGPTKGDKKEQMGTKKANEAMTVQGWLKTKHPRARGQMGRKSRRANEPASCGVLRLHTVPLRRKRRDLAK